MSAPELIAFLAAFIACATVASVLYAVIALLVSYMRDEE